MADNNVPQPSQVSATESTPSSNPANTEDHERLLDGLLALLKGTDLWSQQVHTNAASQDENSKQTLPERILEVVIEYEISLSQLKVAAARLMGQELAYQTLYKELLVHEAHYKKREAGINELSRGNGRNLEPEGFICLSTMILRNHDVEGQSNGQEDKSMIEERLTTVGGTLDDVRKAAGVFNRKRPWMACCTEADLLYCDKGIEVLVAEEKKLHMKLSCMTAQDEVDKIVKRVYELLALIAIRSELERGLSTNPCKETQASVAETYDTLQKVQKELHADWGRTRRVLPRIRRSLLEDTTGTILKVAQP